MWHDTCMATPPPLEPTVSCIITSRNISIVKCSVTSQTLIRTRHLDVLVRTDPANVFVRTGPVETPSSGRGQQTPSSGLVRTGPVDALVRIESVDALLRTGPADVFVRTGVGNVLVRLYIKKHFGVLEPALPFRWRLSDTHLWLFQARLDSVFCKFTVSSAVRILIFSRLSCLLNTVLATSNLILLPSFSMSVFAEPQLLFVTVWVFLITPECSQWGGN